MVLFNYDLVISILLSADVDMCAFTVQEGASMSSSPSATSSKIQSVLLAWASVKATLNGSVAFRPPKKCLTVILPATSLV